MSGVFGGKSVRIIFDKREKFLSTFCYFAQLSSDAALDLEISYGAMKIACSVTFSTCYVQLFYA